MIDNWPAPGRFAFQPPENEAFLVKPQAHKLSRVSGQRLVYLDHEGNERFFYKTAFFCDTLEEVQQILEADAEVRKAYSDFSGVRAAILNKIVNKQG